MQELETDKDETEEVENSAQESQVAQNTPTDSGGDDSSKENKENANDGEQQNRNKKKGSSRVCILSAEKQNISRNNAGSASISCQKTKNANIFVVDILLDKLKRYLGIYGICFCVYTWM